MTTVLSTFRFGLITLDKLCDNDYSLIYFHHGYDEMIKPTWKWLATCYRSFDRKFVAFLISNLNKLIISIIFHLDHITLYTYQHSNLCCTQIANCFLLLDVLYPTLYKNLIIKRQSRFPEASMYAKLTTYLLRVGNFRPENLKNMISR